MSRRGNKSRERRRYKAIRRKEQRVLERRLAELRRARQIAGLRGQPGEAQ